MPMTRAEAEALARQWASGRLVTKAERARVLRDRFAQAGDDDGPRLDDLYPVRAQGVDYMLDKGLKTLEVEIDRQLLEQMQCEQDCANSVRSRAAVIDLSLATRIALYRECLLSCASSSAGALVPEAGDVHTQQDTVQPRTKHSSTALRPGRSRRKSNPPDSSGSADLVLPAKRKSPSSTQE